MYGHISTLALLFAMTLSNNACVAGSAAAEVGDAQVKRINAQLFGGGGGGGGRRRK